MAASSLTENDILKGLVRKGAMTELCKELNAQLITSPRQGESQTDLKLGGPEQEQKD